MCDSKKFYILVWLFPFLFLIHDIEEMITIERFIDNHSDIIPLSITTLQFTVAFCLLWVLTIIACYKISHNRPFLGMEPITLFSFIVPGIFLANGVGHVLQMIYFQSYVPGIITAVVIIFPYSLYALKQLLAKKLLSVKKFIRFVIIGFVLQAPFALLALLIGKLLF
jgi:hypothetical protein